MSATDCGGRFPLRTDRPEYLWRRVADHLAARIDRGEFGPRLPNRGALARDYGVSVATVDRAVRLLTERGTTRTLPGKGTYLR